MLCLTFLNMQACESWKVEERATQPACLGYKFVLRLYLGPSRHVLKQDKYLAHGLFSLSLLPRQEDLTSMVQ